MVRIVKWIFDIPVSSKDVLRKVLKEDVLKVALC